MKLYEHQAKAILAAHGVAIPGGGLAATPTEAEAIARRIIASGRAVVLKAQILAGGRGKGGGVRTAASLEEARRMAEAMFAARLITPQTGPAGLPVRRLLLEASVDIGRQVYLAATIDRHLGQAIVLASGQGGMEIEDLARSSPSAVIRQPIPALEGLSPALAGMIASACGLNAPEAAGFTAVLTALWKAFLECDAGLIEINPLGWSAAGGWIALDAKMVLDDAALPRHPELTALRDTTDEDRREARAAASGISYIRLDGDIGCLVNGAGLAMATADMIEQAGGRPANFLDIGGGVGEDAVREGFWIVASDPGVRAVLINVFGGIVRCDLVARGISRASRDFGLHVPLVVRMLGTNAEAGRRILAESGLDYLSAETMDEAAAMAVAAAAAGDKP
ncbi:MAG: ADP-forming succinate--CoA ligase subunit beta [Acidobacteriota bacterium]|nr:ADP-forming succinate--CoA ligase subunit beta [Acidobacteriota bacterium]